jgi:hypothetical protein
MNKEQVRFYKLFAARTQQQFDRKDLRLFDFLRRTEEEEAEEVHLEELPEVEVASEGTPIIEEALTMDHHHLSYPMALSSINPKTTSS